MLSDKEKIKQLEKMLRQSQKKLELSEKKRRQAEEQLVRADITMKRVEDRIDSGDLTLAAVLLLLNKSINKLLPTDLVDLPHERLRVLKELLLEVQFDVSGSGADQISGLLRYLKNKGTEKAKKLLRENARSIPQKVDELWKASEGAIRSVGKQEKVLADTFDSTKQGAKLAAQDNAKDCVVQACNDIAAGCKATAPLKRRLAAMTCLRGSAGRPSKPSWMRRWFVRSARMDLRAQTAARAIPGAISERRKTFCAHSMKARQNFCATSTLATTCTFASVGKDTCICLTMRRFR